MHAINIKILMELQNLLHPIRKKILQNNYRSKFKN